MPFISGNLMRFVQNSLLYLIPIPVQNKKYSQTAKLPKTQSVQPTPSLLHFEQDLLQLLTIVPKRN
jgi:hypothetical protein